jgi:hypothetical protein
MVALQLYIEGEQVEMFKDESVSLTQTIQNVKDISKIFADFSKTFTVPASKNNNKIFQHYYNSAIVGFDARIKKDAELHLNYKLFKKGRIKLESVDLANNKGKSYKLTFYSHTVNLKDVIGDDKLSSLELLSDTQMQFNYNSTNIIAYLQDGLDVYLEEFIDDVVLVPLITHTDRLYYKSSEDVASTFNLHFGSNVHGVSYEQLKPALRIHAIIKAIEHRYNKANRPNEVFKTLKFSSDFFTSTNLAYYNLYMWLHKKKGNVKEDDEQSTSRIGSMTPTFGNSTIAKMGIGRGDISLGIQSQILDYRMYIKIITTSTDYSFTIFRAGEVFLRKEGLSGDQVIINYDDITDVGAGTFYFEVSSGSATTYSLVGSVKRMKGGTQKDIISFAGSATVAADFNFIVGDQLPDMKVLDFLTGIFKMFNLTAYYDELTEEIKVMPLDEFYSSSTTTHDITKYLDKKSSVIQTLLPYKEIDFNYKGLESFFASDHLQRFNKDWGRERYNAGAKYDGGTYKVELPFEHHKYERLYNGSTATSAQWGWSVNKDKNSHIGDPLLFYPIKNSGNSISVLPTNSSKTEVSNYYVPSNSVSLTDSQNINFAAEPNEYTGVPFNKTLFDQYYKTYIVETFDLSRRLYKFKAYLPISVIINLELQDKIIVFDSLYKINSITTNFETGLSELELINVVTGLAVVDNDNELADTIDKAVITVDSTKVKIDVTSLTI